VLGVAALAAHSTVDGAVYAAAFGHDHGSGVLASAGLMLHEGPEGVVAALLCLQAGWRPPIAAAAAVAASSLTTPLGWGLASLLDGAGHGVVDAAFALSAGLLVWVGGHLLIAGARAVAQTVSRGGDRGV
jgi:zinc transporter ZupT